MTARLRAAPLALLLVGCLRDPLDDPDETGPTVDAEVYALGFCATKCFRLARDCGEIAEGERTSCTDSCQADAVAALPDDPCWAEWIELRRCVARETSCELAGEETPTASADEACAQPRSDLDACEG